MCWLCCPHTVSGCAGLSCMLLCGQQLLASIAGRQVECHPTCSVDDVKQVVQHATAIPSRTYPLFFPCLKDFVTRTGHTLRRRWYDHVPHPTFSEISKGQYRTASVWQNIRPPSQPFVITGHKREYGPGLADIQRHGVLQSQAVQKSDIQSVHTSCWCYHRGHT